MGKFIFDGGERSSMTASVYLAERVYQGAVGGIPNNVKSKNYLLKNKSYALTGIRPSNGEVQILADGGSSIKGTIRGKTGSKTIYLGEPLIYDVEHTFEGGVVAAKLEKNGVVLANDISGFNMMIKFQIANIAQEELRELMLVSKSDDEGVRNISANPKNDIYQRFYLVSLVEQLADGSYAVLQARNCRITIAMATGGGEEHKKAEVSVTPIRDHWAEEEFNYMSDLILTEARINEVTGSVSN